MRDLFYSFVYQLTPSLHVNVHAVMDHESSFNAKFKRRLHFASWLGTALTFAPKGIDYTE